MAWPSEPGVANAMLVAVCSEHVSEDAGRRTCMAWPSEPEGATTAPVADMPVPDAAITSSCSGSSSTSGAGARGAAGMGPASVAAPACTQRAVFQSGAPKKAPSVGSGLGALTAHVMQRFAGSSSGSSSTNGVSARGAAALGRPTAPAPARAP